MCFVITLNVLGNVIRHVLRCALVLCNCCTKFFISALIDIAQVRAFGKYYKMKLLSIFSTFWFYKQYAQKNARKNWI